MDSDSKNFNKVDVKPSAVHGQGVFAMTSFRAGEVVVFWETTKEITSAEHQSLPENERSFVDIQNDNVLYIGKPERFVNHSCEPNTWAGVLCDIALRDIRADEEITTDYGQVFISSGHFQCRCGSSVCRGIIYGRE